MFESVCFDTSIDDFGSYPPLVWGHPGHAAFSITVTVPKFFITNARYKKIYKIYRYICVVIPTVSVEKFIKQFC